MAWCHADQRYMKGTQPQITWWGCSTEPLPKGPPAHDTIHRFARSELEKQQAFVGQLTRLLTLPSLSKLPEQLNISLLSYHQYSGGKYEHAPLVVLSPGSSVFDSLSPKSCPLGQHKLHLQREGHAGQVYRNPQTCWNFTQYWLLKSMDSILNSNTLFLQIKLCRRNQTYIVHGYCIASSCISNYFRSSFRSFNWKWKENIFISFPLGYFSSFASLAQTKLRQSTSRTEMFSVTNPWPKDRLPFTFHKPDSPQRSMGKDEPGSTQDCARLVRLQDPEEGVAHCARS